MAFSRDDLVAYESKPQVQVESHDPWSPSQGDVKTPEVDTSPQGNAETDVDAAIAASITEPAESGDNDGSTTETQAETVAANPANPEGAKDPDEFGDVTDGDRPRSRAQERIEELVAERNALRKYGEYLLSQVEGQRKAPQADSQPVPPTAQDEVAPTIETADYDPIKLSQLQAEWIQKQVDKQVKAVVQQLENRQSEQATRQAFEQRTVEFRKQAADFDTVLSNPALPRLSPEAAKEVIRSEKGPAIAYHLGKNPDLAARIARMEPSSQAAAIGRLEEQLSRATQKEPSKEVPKVAPKAPSVTKAPPPPKPVTGGSGVVQKDTSIMSMDEWVANERNQKIAAKQARLKMRNAMR